MSTERATAEEAAESVKSAARRKTRLLTHGAVRSTFATMLRLSCRPVITGMDNVPAEGGFIVASNHLSFLDSVLIQALFPRQVSFFAKAEYFTSPGLKGRGMRMFFESVGSVPVERQKQSASVEALHELGRIAAEGYGVGIYPEGTRSRDGRLYRGKSGVGWLALATGLPVVPVGLVGTEKLQAADSHTMRPARFEMHVGAPLRFEHLGQKHPLPVRREATAQVMDAIAAMSGQQRAEGYNAPPAAAQHD